MKPLSDNQAYEALTAARAALGEEPGETVHGDTALKAARLMLKRMADAVLAAGEIAADRRDGVLKDQAEP